MYKIVFSVFLIFFAFPSWCQTTFSGGNFSSSKNVDYFNDFSDDDLNGAQLEDDGKQNKKAAKIQNGKLIIKLEPGMYAIYSKKFERFELEINKINKSHIVNQKFKIKSKKNIIEDRVLVSQIKFRAKNSGSPSPIASVFLDRMPNCVTWSKQTTYELKKEIRVFKTKMHSGKKLWVWVEKKGDLYQHSWHKERWSNRENFLNDGKWHSVEMEVYPHYEKGYCKIFIDGNSMIEIYNANTISYSSNQMHGDYVARIGIYRDSYENSHEVQFDDWEIKSRK